MKHGRKRLLSILLSLVMVLGLIPGMSLTAYADPSVAISPSGTGTVDVTTTGSGVRASYVLTANPAAGYRFSKFTWLDDENKACSDTAHPWIRYKTLVDNGYYNNITAVFELLVTGVTLNPNAAQTITVGDKVSFTASVQPDGVTDKKVKWSVGGSAVKLYSDANCTEGNEVTLDIATETLTVYAKGISVGNATVIATSNADGTKKASCAVTVNPVTYEVTYKVVNGTWSDGSTADKKETVQSGSKLASVPTGMKAASGYTGGAWDTDPASAAITGAKTFTYTFTAKQAATVTKAPEAKTLTYIGSAQELVTAGTATGGEMQYALGTATEATEPYTTSIPSKTDAGTYYVWYKVKGDENHNDTDPAPLSVTISPVDKAELNKAIADAEAYYDAIKDKAAYAEVAAALKKAIDAAKDVAANDNVTESAVAQAIKDINGATDKAKADVAAIDKQAADEVAAKAVIEAIGKLPAEAGVEDKAAVEAARKAYDALTKDQKKLVPEDVVKKLATAEAQVKAAEEAAEVVSITKCRIAVKDRTYTGKVVKKPVVAVRYGKVKLKEGRDYILTYKKARKIGTYKLKVKGIGKYTGTKTLTYKIIPKGTVFTKRTGGDRQITLSWNKRKNITGYQIEYSLKKDFSRSKKILVNKPKIFTKVIRNLKPGKTYYVRIRTYKKVNRKNYISLWSKTKTVKTSGLKGNAPAQVVEVALQAGETLDLNGLFPGGDAWESSDEAVVAVSDGVANALAAGEAVVDGLDAEGEEVSVVITVTESEIGIEGLELGADLSLPGIDELDDGEIVMDDETELTLE